jgi:hypothetical protein
MASGPIEVRCATTTSRPHQHGRIGPERMWCPAQPEAALYRSMELRSVGPNRDVQHVGGHALQHQLLRATRGLILSGIVESVLVQVLI